MREKTREIELEDLNKTEILALYRQSFGVEAPLSISKGLIISTIRGKHPMAKAGIIDVIRYALMLAIDDYKDRAGTTIACCRLCYSCPMGQVITCYNENETLLMRGDYMANATKNAEKSEWTLEEMEKLGKLKDRVWLLQQTVGKKLIKFEKALNASEKQLADLMIAHVTGVKPEELEKPNDEKKEGGRKKKKASKKGKKNKDKEAESEKNEEGEKETKEEITSEPEQSEDIQNPGEVVIEEEATEKGETKDRSVSDAVQLPNELLEAVPDLITLAYRAQQVAQKKFKEYEPRFAELEKCITSLVETVAAIDDKLDWLAQHNMFSFDERLLAESPFGEKK